MMLVTSITITMTMIQDQSSQWAVITHTLVALLAVIAAVTAIALAAISSNRAYHEHYQN
jgi:hypothetical protein